MLCVLLFRYSFHIYSATVFTYIWITMMKYYSFLKGMREQHQSLPKNDNIRKFCSNFSMGVYKNIFYIGKYILKHMKQHSLRWNIWNQCNWLRNNIAQLYFILGKAKLHWNFSSIPKDGSDFPTGNGSQPISLWNLWISENFSKFGLFRGDHKKVLFTMVGYVKIYFQS